MPLFTLLPFVFTHCPPVGGPSHFVRLKPFMVKLLPLCSLCSLW